jgi:hypothetical protein
MAARNSGGAAMKIRWKSMQADFTGYFNRGATV